MRGGIRLEAALAAEEHSGNSRAALAVEAEVAHPRNLAGRAAARSEVGAQRRDNRGSDAPVLQCRIGRHGTDPTEAVDRVTPEADCRALRVAGGERGAEHGRAVELGNPVRVRARRELMGGVAGLALYDDTLRWRLPERRVDGHVGTAPVAL